MQRSGVEARPLEAVHRLADLPDRASLEREPLDLDDRLVPVVERVQSVGAIARQRVLRSAEHGDAPVALVGERDVSLEEPLEAVWCAHRVPRDDGHAADDLVGEERALVLVEEVRLVGAEDERRERVDAPGCHERACELALARLLAEPVAPRPEPGRDDPGHADAAGEEDGLREPGADLAHEVRRPAQVQADEGAAGLAEGEAEGERLVGHEAVDPERSDPVRVDRDHDPGRTNGHAGLVGRISQGGELVPPRDEGHREERGDRSTEREPVQQLEERRRREDPDGEPPGSALAPRKAARRKDEREPGRSHERAHDRVDAGRRERVHEAAAVVRKDPFEHAENAGRCDA